VIDPGLFHNSIGRVPRQNLVVDREAPVRDRAVPKFMVALSMSLPATTGVLELLDDERLEVSH
jgi:hypothetical protein